MPIEEHSKDIFILDLPKEPKLKTELMTTKIVVEENDRNLVIDFSHIDLITSSSLARLLELRKILINSKHKLILCSVAPKIKNIFYITGLDEIFEIADDKFLALVILQT